MSAASIEAADGLEAIATEAIKACHRRGKYLRQDHLQDIEKRWLAVNQTGVLGRGIDRPNKHSLYIREGRLTAVHLRLKNEDGVLRRDLEPGVSATWMALRLLRKLADTATTPYFSCSLHALGRRYQRSDPGDISDQSMVRDLQQLSEAVLPLIMERPWNADVDYDTTPDKFTIKTAAGEWRGKFSPVVYDGGKPGKMVAVIASVRTYLEAGQLQDVD